VEETPHLTAVRRQWHINSLAAGKKFRVINGELERYAGSPPARSVEQALADALAAQERARIAERAKIGQMIPGQGIYIGKWAPKDSSGKSLGKIFNIYAAPEDLTDDITGKKAVFTYNNTLKRLAALRNWHGHNGASYTTDKELLKALKDGSYKGGWFIPPLEALVGKDAKANKTQPDNLFAHKDNGALKNTFTTKGATGYTYPEWYWSSTESPETQGAVKAADFSRGTHTGYYKDILHLSCRPVRLVEV
jgi:hypothetical protein